MRIGKITCALAALLAALPQVKATTNVLAAWTFNNLSLGANATPSPSSGLGSASVVDLTGPQVISAPAGSSTGGPNAWQIASGYSTSAAVGAQGAQFAASSAGYYRIMVSFDVNATSDAEANLQVQYTTQGTIWNNAANVTSGGAASVTSNANTNLSTVIGTYVKLANGWNNQILVDLSGISGVDNNPNFAIRLVNASSGTNCVTTTGAIYNNTSGSWTFDNIVIQGISIDTIAAWTFLGYGSTNAAAPINNPVPDINTTGNASTAQIMGFNLPTLIFSDGSHGSTNWGDVTSQTGSSTPANPWCWRLRGQNPGNGWNTQEPVGSQGAEFDVSTVNYSNIVVSFDAYFTSQGEAKMCVLYTIDGWTNTLTANSLFYGANPTFILTNDPVVYPGTYSPNTVTGTYFYETTGQNFYNNWVVDFTGVPGVDNNPYFGIRYVNAATAGDCVANNGGSYNNSSGNTRLANVNFGGQYNGFNPPAIATAANVTVDNPWTNTFTDNLNWRTNITAVYVNGVILTNSAAYTTNIAGGIAFTPSKDSVLQVAGVDTIVIYATGYGEVKVTQPVAAGVFKKFATAVSVLGPSASGGTLENNPVFTLSDQYNNTTTNPYANVAVSATVATNGATGPSAWTLGGATNQSEVNGVVTFTNLSATVSGVTAVTGAVVNITITGYTNTANHTTTTNFNLPAFTIGAPPVPYTPGNIAVFQIDTLSNNTTFSMIELKPSAAAQTAPVNIVPISATGTNALRMAPSATTGRLCLSDDGTLLCFAAFVDGSSATADETLNLSRAAVGVNYTNLVSIGATYNSVSFGGSQARSACTLDDTNWVIDDKGGLYEGSGFIGNPNVNALNNVVVKTFGQNGGVNGGSGWPGYPNGQLGGHTPYVQTQKTANGSPIPVVYQLTFDDINSTFDVEQGNNLGTDPIASDFYLISTNAGTTFDIMYINEQNSSSAGNVLKYSWVNGNWMTNGMFTNATGVDGLFVTTNGSGGVYIYYTTGGGGSGGNSVVRLTDESAWNQPINITTVNTLYTAPKTASLKGLTFVPLQTAYATELIPPPILTAQSGATVGASFSITNTPDDPTWRGAITLVTVNGSTLPSTAYDTTQAGVITFNPALSALLQTSGNKTIGFKATGYSSNSVVQALAAGAATQLIFTTQPTAPAADGGVLAHQPVLKAEDAFGNVVTAVANITAAPTQGTWTLGGTTTVGTTAGVATFSGLTAFSPSALTGATITFSDGGLMATSAVFNIPAPVLPTINNVVTANGKFSFAFTNPTGLSFSVLGTNNVRAPVSTWPKLGTSVESPAGSGNYQFTNSIGTNADMFYILRQP